MSIGISTSDKYSKTNNFNLINTPVPKWTFGLNSLFSEIFGIFIPGVIVVCVTVMFYVVALKILMSKNLFDLILEFFGKPPYSLVWIFLVSLSYAVGAVIFRLGPKTPDYIAAYKQWARSTPDEQARMAVNFDKRDMVIGVGCNTVLSYITDLFQFLFFKSSWVKKHAKINPDFPYPYLRIYLKARNFDHLLKYVRWCDKFEVAASTNNSDKLTSLGKKARSKQALNIIKQRLRLIENFNYEDIARNEGHVRMLSSLWYVMRYSIIIFTTLFFVIIGKFCYEKFFAVEGNSVCLVQKEIKNPMKSKKCRLMGTGEIAFMDVSYGICAERVDDTNQQNPLLRNDSKSLLLIGAFLVLCFIFAILKIKDDIEKGLHYVRTREIVMVLESLYTALCFNDKIDVFDDIVSKYDDFCKKHCKYCIHKDKCC